MVVDILELPFKGDVVPKYSALIPVVLSQPHAPDDVYVLGYETTFPIHDRLHRYKIIEHINGEIFEHVAITTFKIPLYKKDNRLDSRPIYIITTRHYSSSGIKTYRYFKNIEQLLGILRIKDLDNVKTIHQLALSALNSFNVSHSHLSEMEIFLGQYVYPRHKVLTHLTTASISEAISIMSNVCSIHDELDRALSDRTVNTNELNDWLDHNLYLPTAPPTVGLCGILMGARTNKIITHDLEKMINKSDFGRYQNLLSTDSVVPFSNINDINTHIRDATDTSCTNDLLISAINNTCLLEALTDLELCEYTDLSIEFVYSKNNNPDVHIHYSGSIFNNFSLSYLNNTIIKLNISSFYNALRLYYGDVAFDNDRPTIQVCKTFSEDVYIKFITKDGKEWVDYFDLTILSILSPVVLDSTAERYIWKQICCG